MNPTQPDATAAHLILLPVMSRVRIFVAPAQEQRCTSVSKIVKSDSRNVDVREQSVIGRVEIARFEVRRRRFVH
jgi:hypothetical protein